MTYRCKKVRRTSSRHLKKRNKPNHKFSGFTLIELMIVIAIIAIILSLALPVYTNYSIRAKIGESLSVAAATKTAVASACMEDTTLTGLTNNKVGYLFTGSKWVDEITVSNICLQPIITIVTKDTGAPTPAPEIILTGGLTASFGSMTWVCGSSNAENYLLPKTCRS